MLGFSKRSQKKASKSPLEIFDQYEQGKPAHQNAISAILPQLDLNAASVLPDLDGSTFLDLASIAYCETYIEANRKENLVDILNYGVATANNVAIVGADSYLFIGDGANEWEKQFLGKARLNLGWARKWEKLFKMRRKRAEHEGVQLVNFVIPEKQVLLSHKRWPGIESGLVGAARPMRRLLASLRQDASLLYPEQELRQAEAIAPVYSRHDSHWSVFGCCIAMQALLREIGDTPPLEQLKLAVTRCNRPRDLLMHFFNTSITEDTLRLDQNGVRKEYNEKPERTGRFNGTYYKLQNENAPDKRRIAVFGDSYSFTEGVTYVLSAIFETVVFLWSKDIDWLLIAEQEINVVVWEHAERFMITIPEE
ncbi:alginate O-acetyltransferase AlgX-related protein [Rhizobium miluonense]|jgi:hypothetical protein|uniref:AlgX/AlgJ SGNH hydrolase-like domain-containing protein n=1 Tax=Rhizobium miluonense TaxID=411945 RepID=A0ABU1SMA8_9HYPH|nr:hypothetical protein [Rhizobium miluonense]MDR6899608.1 hypothetical protein [Rhizobium miluonense]